MRSQNTPKTYTGLTAWLMSVPQGSLFWKIIGIIMLYSIGILWLDDHYFPKQKLSEINGATITGVILGLLLVFRTNSAYDRWWEARKLWGQLVNDIRNLCLKLDHYMNLDQDEKEQLAKLLIAFPHALKNHLRDLAPDHKVLKLDPEAAQATNVPLYITGQIYEVINSWKEKKGINGFQQLLLDPHMRSLMDICGACERILKTPIGNTYKEMIWIGLGIYILSMPWMLVPLLDIWSLPIVFLGSYFIVTLELLAEDVEEPFGTSSNDLPIDSICTTIESSVYAALQVVAPADNL